jgi:hypothetical protein
MEAVAAHSERFGGSKGSCGWSIDLWLQISITLMRRRIRIRVKVKNYISGCALK